jgi:hypothetical protein
MLYQLLKLRQACNHPWLVRQTGSTAGGAAGGPGGGRAAGRSGATAAEVAAVRRLAPDTQVGSWGEAAPGRPRMMVMTNCNDRHRFVEAAVFNSGEGCYALACWTVVSAQQQVRCQQQEMSVCCCGGGCCCCCRPAALL